MSVALPFDDRGTQCERAACFMETHPGCTASELAEGAELGSATKVISEMPRFGYAVRKVRATLPCVGGTRLRRGAVRYFLESRPSTGQRDLFVSE